MVRKLFLITFFSIFLFYMVFGCTSIVVTKSATIDGSVINSYNCDGEYLHHFGIIPAADHKDGETVEIKSFDGTVTKIPQVKHTYKVVDLMNENQVAISETTFEGRKELVNPDGLFYYWTLMRLALERSKTAREAIKVITSLANKYGYKSSGETFSITDKNEAWILEVIGKGKGEKGIIWVAVKVPEGEMVVHSNSAIIGSFPMNNPDVAMYSPDVVDFAIKKGYYNPKSKKSFSFRDAYDPCDLAKLRYTELRRWSVYRRVAPSKKFSPDFALGKSKNPYPFSIKPDYKLSVKKVISLLRDHYEGTPFDMNVGLSAGPFSCPYRWRPISWVVDGKEYVWQRPISTQQTSFTFVSQSRADLPDPIGGVYWFGFDDTYLTCYIPIYCSVSYFPKEYQVGSLSSFSYDSAWWVFNLVSNLCYARYSDRIKDVQKLQSQLEGNFFKMQPYIEKTALMMYKDGKKNLLNTYLSDYSYECGKKVYEKWVWLSKYLITKYNDGYVQDENGRPHAKGYSQQWLRKVIKDEGKRLFLKKEDSKK